MHELVKYLLIIFKYFGHVIYKNIAVDVMRMKNINQICDSWICMLTFGMLNYIGINQLDKKTYDRATRLPILNDANTFSSLITY